MDKRRGPKFKRAPCMVDAQRFEADLKRAGIERTPEDHARFSSDMARITLRKVREYAIKMANLEEERRNKLHVSETSYHAGRQGAYVEMANLLRVDEE